MQEYIVSCLGYWWHFFYKPSYGLCFRKKDGMRFTEFEILLKEAENDFCVFAIGNTIHIVCQDHAGAILYLVYNGENWEKLSLLTNKDGKPSPKHFSLWAVGKHLNLFYVIEYKEKMMLIHQMLHSPNTAPTVVDYITPSHRPYQICQHSSNDLTVCYQNEQGICGMRNFIWSQKNYQPFRRLTPSLSSCAPACYIEQNDVCHFAATSELENVKNLIYFRLEADGSFSDSSTVYLDCKETSAPIFFRKDERLYLEWLDNGSVMMSYFADENERWKKPVKYMRNAATPIILYHICEEGKTSLCYGFSDNGSINLYGMDDIFAHSPKAAAAPKYRSQGFEAAKFAEQFGYRPQAIAQTPEHDFISVGEFHNAHSEIKQLLSKQNDIILELSRRISKLEDNLAKNISQPPLAEHEEDIDTILLKDVVTATHQQNTQKSKLTVTGK